MNEQIRLYVPRGHWRDHHREGYSKDLWVRVVTLVEEGESAQKAARVLNLGVSIAIRWIHRWRKTGSVEERPGTLATAAATQEP